MAKSRILTRRFYGEAMQAMTGTLRTSVSYRDEILDSAGYTDRRVLGYKLPEWLQRPPSWTKDQDIAFVESMWMGINVGAFMVNEPSVAHELEGILVDGQQRLSALARYWKSEFPIAGDNGQEYYWGELEAIEQAQLDRIPFPWICTKYTSRAVLVGAYNRHNFGGTPHLPDQMA